MTRTPSRPTVVAALLLLLAPLLAPAGGCAFDRKWRKLAREPEVATSDGLAGRWAGTWKSERSGHRGTLRAIITPVNETTYRADYDATYMGLLRFGYSMNLTAEPADGGGIRFTGEENLGALAGGLYRYDGTADGQSFECAYEAKADHGRFQMTRPAPRDK